jgi:2,3-dihydroxybenzoate decarboxylase
MRYIALEEAFFIAELAERQPMPALPLAFRTEFAEHILCRLTDFTEYRLPEMDEAGIDIHVLSLTIPGMQVDIEAGLARENARFANNYLAQVISEHPDRFHGFAALPLQDPAAAADELHRAVTELGFRGALVNDCVHGPGGRYLDAPEYDEVWSALESLGVPLYLHPGARQSITGVCSTGIRNCTGLLGVGPPKPVVTRCGSSTAGYSIATPAQQ